MSTLAVVEEILHETLVPMTVRQIVDRAGARLPSKSKTPETVVARDLAMDIKKHGEGSLFIRTSPGRYCLRSLVSAHPAKEASDGAATDGASSVQIARLSDHLGENAAPTRAAPLDNAEVMAPIAGEPVARKPAAAAAGPLRPVGSRDSAEGGGYAG